jgi:putative addiction module killer protein
VFIAKLLAFRQQIDSQKSIKIGKIFQGNHLSEDAETIVVLLCGGDKNTQDRDIEAAKAYWKEYRHA